jgi:hypothetical protein
MGGLFAKCRKKKEEVVEEVVDEEPKKKTAAEIGKEYKTLCIKHKKMGEMFCECRNEPICEDCISKDNHTGGTHK